MHRKSLKGRLVDNANYVNGNQNIIMMTIAVKDHYDFDIKKYLYRLVPCIVFELDKKLANTLIKKGQGIHISCEGIQSSLNQKSGLSNEKKKAFLIDPESIRLIK